MFSSLRKHHTDFHSGCTSLHALNKCSPFPISRPALVIIRFLLVFILSYFAWGKMKSQSGFNLYFLMALGNELLKKSIYSPSFENSV